MIVSSIPFAFSSIYFFGWMTFSAPWVSFLLEEFYLSRFFSSGFGVGFSCYS